MYEYSTYVTSVTDGDTFSTSTQHIRLANINTPENSTSEGQISTQSMLNWKLSTLLATIPLKLLIL